MPFESITDIKISELLSMTKTVSNPKSKLKEKDGHEQYTIINCNLKMVNTSLNYTRGKIYVKEWRMISLAGLAGCYQMEMCLR